MSDYNKPETEKSHQRVKRNFDTDSDRAKKTKMPAKKRKTWYFEEDEPLEMTYFHLTRRGRFARLK